MGRGSLVGAAAISTDYPAQLMHLAAKDNAKVLTENESSDGAALSCKRLQDLSASWRFDRVERTQRHLFQAGECTVRRLLTHAITTDLLEPM
ncbi:MAG: hypothetical protein ACLUOF_03140 [Ruminococcus sp.]